MVDNENNIIFGQVGREGRLFIFLSWNETSWKVSCLQIPFQAYLFTKVPFFFPCITSRCGLWTGGNCGIQYVRTNVWCVQLTNFYILKKKKKPYPPIQLIRIFFYSIIKLNFSSIVISNNIFIIYLYIYILH